MFRKTSVSLQKKRLTLSHIGVILHHSHGIAQVNSVTGSKILMILKANMRHPLMVVATADRNLIAFNLRNTQVGSIKGRVGVHHLDEQQSSKNFTFKCDREGNEIYFVNSLNFHLVHQTFATAGSDGAFNFWDKDRKQRLKSEDTRMWKK
ncbi:unnamed protein product [Lactuca saligna]|uniref:Uncharacterized protein n=1 Tax=Lactuca saligna TaxID=75948 RepID=A0AA35ZK87_LACSI|nr:unnamed protein product [Lactuca saligna]